MNTSHTSLCNKFSLQLGVFYLFVKVMASQVGKKLSRSASGLRMVPISDKFASPFALLEPLWIPDRESGTCKSCNTSFDFLTRRHHCRRCGLCFCQRCCHHQIRLYRMYFVDPVRQCYDCAIMSRSECDFYERSLSVLIKGISVIVYDDDEKNVGQYSYHLSNDHRYLKYKQLELTRSGNIFPFIPTISVTSIISVHFSVNEENDNPRNKTPTGFVISFKDESEPSINHRLRMVAIDPAAARAWLISFQKALKLLYETRDSSKPF